MYATLARRPGYHLPTGLVVWLLNYSWFVGLSAIPLVILLFPDGAPPSRRWRWVMWAYLATVGCFAVTVYALVIGAFAGHHTRIDASGQLVEVYTGLVLLATQVLTLRSPVAVAGSTLVAAALFSPLRSRVQRAVDRRFNRARYDADQMVAAFAARLKDAVDLDAVQADLASVVQQALEPAHVSLWRNNHG